MKYQSYKYPKSSFLGIAKDTALIIDKIISNKDILKLIYYNTRDWKSKPDLTTQQIKEMFETGQINNIPKINIDRERKTYLKITCGSTVPNQNNPEYRDNVFGIDIICHWEDWALDNFEIRPIRIAAEIDSMLDNTHLTGIGVLHFVSSSPAIYSQEYGGISLNYLAIRGNEDEVNPLS